MVVFDIEMLTVDTGMMMVLVLEYSMRRTSESRGGEKPKNQHQARDVNWESHLGRRKNSEILCAVTE